MSQDPKLTPIAEMLYARLKNKLHGVEKKHTYTPENPNLGYPIQVRFLGETTWYVKLNWDLPMGWFGFIVFNGKITEKFLKHRNEEGDYDSDSIHWTGTISYPGYEVTNWHFTDNTRTLLVNGRFGTKEGYESFPAEKFRPELIRVFEHIVLRRK